MIQIGKDYFYHEGELYKKIKPQLTPGRITPRYYITTKTGKRKWITKTELEKLVKHRAM